MSDLAGSDLTALLAPIPGDAPCGPDPRADASPQSLYYRLRDARAEARAMERELDRGSDTDSSELRTALAQRWRTVRETAARLLTEKARDLEAAGWLTEALVRSEGLAGLTSGASLMAGLLETFWDTGLYPAADEDGIATRMAPVAALAGPPSGADGTLAAALRKLPLLSRADGDLTLWEFRRAEEVEAIGDAKEKKRHIEGGVASFTDVEREARAVAAKHFGPLRDQVDAALAAWDRLTAAVDQKAGAGAPSTGAVRKLLVDFRDVVARYAPARTMPDPTMPEAGTEPLDETGAPTIVAIGPRKAASREDMLQELARIAEFFRHTEPQSPLSLTLEEAVRRARLSWPELLAEVVPNEDARNAMLIMLGIRPTKPDS